MSSLTDLANATETVLESAHAVSEKTDLVLQKVSDLAALVTTLQAGGGADQAQLDDIAAKLADVQSSLAGTAAKEDAALTPPPAAA